MFFELLNKSQRTIAASSVLVLGIVQIALDSWTLYKIQEHEEIILFLTGNAIPSSVMQDMTYEQALSYFSRLKGFLSKDLLEILDILRMTTVFGLVAGILQLFSSTAGVMWRGRTVDIFWLVINFIASVFLSVAVCYIALNMIRDVPYHQVLLTVTAVNLFITTHIWILNTIALKNSMCNKAEDQEERDAISEGTEDNFSRSRRSSARTNHSQVQMNTQ